MIEDKLVRFYRVMEDLGEDGPYPYCIFSDVVPADILNSTRRGIIGFSEVEAVDNYIAKQQAIIDEATRKQEQARALLKGENVR